MNLKKFINTKEKCSKCKKRNAVYSKKIITKEGWTRYISLCKQCYS